MPQRSAEISVRISSNASILSTRAFSTLRILPLSGRMAWVSTSRPWVALPPAESPSTMNSSERRTSRVLQSRSLCGMEPDSSALLRRVSSRALRAASRAWAASTPFMVRRLASAGCSSSHDSNACATTDAVNPSISGFSSLSLGWLLKVGSASLTDTIAIRPSRRSSPVGVGSFSLMSPDLRA